MTSNAKDGKSMNRSKAEEIVTRLLCNAAGLEYGSVSVTAKLHEGRIVGLVYSTTENTREAEIGNEKANKSDFLD